MKNYLITVNGNEYEVEVEELSNGQREEKTINRPLFEMNIFAKLPIS